MEDQTVKPLWNVHLKKTSTNHLTLIKTFLDTATLRVSFCKVISHDWENLLATLMGQYYYLKYYSNFFFSFNSVFSAKLDEFEYVLKRQNVVQHDTFVKLRGLPYTCKPEDIEKFFEGKLFMSLSKKSHKTNIIFQKRK